MAKNMKFEGKTTGELEQIMKESKHQLEVEQHCNLRRPHHSESWTGFSPLAHWLLCGAENHPVSASQAVLEA